MTHPVDDETFEASVLKAGKPVLVDFWAPWCGPCRAIAPVISEIGEEAKDIFEVFKMNVDECPVTTAKYGIRSIPTLMVFAGGRIMASSTGVKNREEIYSMFKGVFPEDDVDALIKGIGG